MRTPICLVIVATSWQTAADKIMDVVLGSASWLEETANCRNTRISSRACSWKMNSTDDAPANYPYLSNSLYYGSAGPAIFMLQLADATRVQPGSKWNSLAGAALEDVREGVDDAILNYGTNSGFYYGLSGISWSLREVSTTLARSDIYLQAATRIERYILSNVKPFSRNDSAIFWNNTDIAHGASGTGLAFLWAARHERNHSHSRDLLAGAIAAGKWLLQQAEQVGEGLRWWRGPDTDGDHAGQYYPTFCCGTAGIAYFLVELSLAAAADSKLKENFLQAARKGGKHVLSLSVELLKGTMLLPHGEQFPDTGEYYLGWCGGAAGWGRLFVKLWQATHEQIWLDSLVSAIKGLEAFVLPNLTMKLPVREKSTWQNLGQCCGAAAAGTFMLEFSQSALPLPDELKARAKRAARQIAEAISSHAEKHGGSLVLPSAEEHAKPLDTRWQTGWMQGTAGIASFLLHMHAVDRGVQAGIRRLWPDEPWNRDEVDGQNFQEVQIV